MIKLGCWIENIAENRRLVTTAAEISLKDTVIGTSHFNMIFFIFFYINLNLLNKWKYIYLKQVNRNTEKK